MSTHAPLPTIPSRPGAPGEEFFARIRALGIVRPDGGRWAAGVAAGLARRWGVDPLIVRGAFVVLSVVAGSGLALYGVCWLFLPHPDGRIHAQEVMAGRVTAGFVGSVLAIISGVPNSWWQQGRFGWQPFSGGLLTLAAIGFAIWWIVSRGSAGAVGPAAPPTPTAPGTPPTPTFSNGPAGATSANANPQDPGIAPDLSGSGGSGPAGTAYEPPTPGSGGADTPELPGAAGAPTFGGTGQPLGGSTEPLTAAGPTVAVAVPDTHRPSRAITLATLGAALIAAAVVVLIDLFVTDLPAAPWLVATAVALGVVALGLVAAGLSGRRGGGLVPLAIVLAIVAINGATWRSVDGFGDRTWAPATAAAATAQPFDLGAGNAVLDLRSAAVTAGATSASPVRVPVNLGAGNLRILLPATATAQVDAEVGLGNISDNVNGTQRSGPGSKLTIASGTSAPVLVVTVDVGVGNVEVSR